MITRRSFLEHSGAIVLGFSGLRSLLTNLSSGAQTSYPFFDRFGELIADPNGILDLPKGFSYTVLSRTGDPMDDGLLVPGRHDGMAAFPGPNGRTILVRNHELEADQFSLSPFGRDNERLDLIDDTLLYDDGGGIRPSLGGTTTLVYDTEAGVLEQHFLSLAGTVRNCAGGPTPWGTWITCEETVQRAAGSFAQDHGYNFEVPVTTTPGLAAAVPLKAMGRFNHEAVAVHPASGIVYQTEDRDNGLLYRFLPEEPGNLAAGGRLQALMLLGQPSTDTRNWNSTTIAQGASLPVGWVDLDDVEAPRDDLRARGFGAGAARFARGEGMWYGEGAVFFACTNGGRTRTGQIWRYVPSPLEGQEGELAQPGQLELFLEPNDRNLLDNADNVTVAPWGDLIICEDGSGSQFLVGIQPDGTIYKFARNALNASELAGATFSPDGTTLFMNIQTPGLTLAITGPWEGTPVAVEEDEPVSGFVSRLGPNYPNPFQDETHIPFQVGQAGHVVLLFYNLLGERVRTIDLGYRPAGDYTQARAASWDGRDAAGHPVPSGVYLCQLQIGAFTAMSRLVVQR